MARISGVDLPNDKRVEIGLTYIYGIGRTTATQIIEATGINPTLDAEICPKMRFLKFVITLKRT